MLDHPLFKRVIAAIIVVSAVLSAVGGIMQGAAAQHLENRNLWKGVLIYGGLGIILVCVALLIVASRRAKEPVEVQWPEPAVKTAADRLVRHLHERWFMSGKAFNAGYRVALFMPRTLEPGGVEWTCVARTITPPERAATWTQVDDRQARTTAGLVNFAVTSGTLADVLGVPEEKRKDKVAVKDYLVDSCLTEQLQAARSWPWATIRVRIARGLNFKILCAIVVEREDGHPIEMTSRKLDFTEKKGNVQRTHDPCEWEHQLVAEVWATVRDHS